MRCETFNCPAKASFHVIADSGPEDPHDARVCGRHLARFIRLIRRYGAWKIEVKTLTQPGDGWL